MSWLSLLSSLISDALEHYVPAALLASFQLMKYVILFPASGILLRTHKCLYFHICMCMPACTIALSCVLSPSPFPSLPPFSSQPTHIHFCDWVLVQRDCLETNSEQGSLRSPGFFTNEFGDLEQVTSPLSPQEHWKHHIIRPIIVWGELSGLIYVKLLETIQGTELGYQLLTVTLSSSFRFLLKFHLKENMILANIGHSFQCFLSHNLVFPTLSTD